MLVCMYVLCTVYRNDIKYDKSTIEETKAATKFCIICMHECMLVCYIIIL